MNMTRRTFILSSGLVAAAPALASVLATAPNPESSMLPSAAGLQPAPPVTQTAGYDLPFRIDGWEPRPEIAPGDAQTASPNAAIQPPADEQMWISINQSWRATWR